MQGRAGSGPRIAAPQRLAGVDAFVVVIGRLSSSFRPDEGEIMVKQMYRGRLFAVFAAVAAIVGLAIVSSASAHTGIWERFNYCPSKTAGVNKCVQSVTSGGSVVLGKKTVPIVNPVTLQGGLGAPEEKEEIFYEKFIAATNGVSLSPTPQPVPGGLTGLVNCKEISNFLLRVGCESVFENGLTGVNAAVELAKPASEIVVSEENLGGEEGTALKLPVKVHLENPLLGSSCYIGSSSSPIIWNLTTGATHPPAPNTSIHGSSGHLTFPETVIAEFSEAKLVDNAWSAPVASGCGGWPAEYILDPIIEASVGVPSAAGHNTAALEKTRITLARAADVNAH
jgi:hypothetical protein